jgi:ACT domain-containing protein
VVSHLASPYSVQFTTTAGGCRDTAQVTVNPVPTIGLTINCTGSTLNNVTVNSTISSGTLEYNVDGGSYQSSNIFTGLTTGVSHTFTVRVVGTLCSNSISQTISCTCPTVMDNVISKSDSICGSGIPTLITGSAPTVTPATSFTYQWQSSLDNTTWTDIVGATNQNYQPTTISITTYYRRLVKIVGCLDNVSNVVIKTVLNLPVCNISGLNSVCSGTVGTTFSGPLGMSSYAWSIIGNGTITSGTTSQDVTVTAGASGSYTLSLSITDANGCISSCTKVVSINALPVCNISGLNSVCSGTVGTTFSGPLGMSSYAWSIIGNGTITSGTTSQDVTVTAGASGSYTLSLSITDANGCISSCTKVVSINALPVCNISGLNSVCSGTVGTTFSGPLGMSSYAWSIIGNGTITSGTTSQDVTVTAGASGSYTLSLSITDANGCISSCTKVVSINALPVCNISGLNSVCSGTVGTTFSGPLGMSSYAWSIIGNGTITSGTTSQDVTVTAGASGSYTLSLSITDANGCISSCTKVVSINALPVCNISGLNSVCSGTVGTTFSGPLGMSSYAWSIIGNGTITSGTTSQDVTVTAGASGSYTLSLSITDANGCISSCTKVVSINALPVCNISGLNSVCSGTVGTTFSGPLGMSSYAWSIIGNGTITSGTTSQDVTVTAGASGSYTLSLSITDANGCISTCTKVVTVNPVPTIGLTVNCTGSTLNNVTVNSTISSGTLEYNVDGGAYQSSNIFTGLTTEVSHTFTVRVVGTLCSNSISQTISCTCPTVMDNVISKSDSICGSGIPTLITGSTPTVTPATSFTYQWQSSLDNTTWTDIVGATNQNYQPTTISVTTYYRRLVKIVGCLDNVSNVVIKTVLNLPVCNISGLNSVCSGTVGTTFSGPLGMSSYAWSIIGNGTITSGTTSQDVTVTAGASGSYTLSLSITDANGCISSCTKVVSINALPVCNISGLNSVCSGTVGTTFSGPLGMSSYAWSIIGNGTITSGTTSQDVTVTAGASGSYTLSLSITDANGCISTCTKVVTVNPVPTIGLTVNCTGSTLNNVTVNSTISSGTLEYNVDGGAYQSSNIFTGLTTEVSHTFTVRVVGTLCSNSISQTISCTCPTVMDNVISKSDSICGSGIPTLITGSTPTVTPATSFTYQWQSSSDNITWTDILGATNQNYQPTTISVTTYYRRLVKIVGCLDNVSNVVIKTVINLVSAGADGSTNTCDNNTSTINLFDLITGEAVGGSWYRNTGSGGVYTTGSNFFTPQGATTSMFMYVVLNSVPCLNDTSYAIVNILKNDTTNVNRTICLSDSITVCGQVYKTTGLYTKICIGIDGCDSIVILNLLVVNCSRDTIRDTNTIYTTRDTLCADIDAGMSNVVTTVELCGHTNNSGNVYTVSTLPGTACIVIYRSGLVGYNLDTLCIIKTDPITGIYRYYYSYYQ